MRYHKVHNLVLMKTKLFHTKKTRNEKNNKRTSWKKLSNVNTIKYPRKWASFSLNKTGSNGVVRIWLRRKPEIEDCPKKKKKTEIKRKAEGFCHFLWKKRSLFQSSLDFLSSPEFWYDIENLKAPTGFKFQPKSKQWQTSNKNIHNYICWESRM